MARRSRALAFAALLLGIGCASSSAPPPRPATPPQPTPATPQGPGAAPPASEPAVVRSGTLTGVVTDPDGVPVPRARVFLREELELGPGIMVDGDHRAVTSSDGAFRISAPPGQYRLYTRLTGWRHLPVYPLLVTVPDGGEAQVGVALQRGLTVTGRLVGPDDEGLAGAMIRANATLPGPDGHYRFMVSEITGPDGAFVMGGLPPGRHLLTVEFHMRDALRARYVPGTLTVEAGATDVRFVLRRAGAVSGVVLDGVTGRPLEGANVEVVRHLHEPEVLEPSPGLERFGGVRPSTGGTYTFGDRYEVRAGATDGQGRYEVLGLPAGRYSVRITARDRQRVVDGLELADGDALQVDATLTEDDELQPARFDLERHADPSKAPCWYDLGGAVYHAGTLEDVERSVLSLSADPRWFTSFDGELAPPRTLEGLPDERAGATLELDVRQADDDPRLLRVSLALRAGERPILREVEHRHTNVLPFLFALRADGENVRTVERRSGWFREGGMNGMVELVPAGGERRWDLVMTVSSLERLLPEPLPDRVELVAAFAERQHEAVGMLTFDRPVWAVDADEDGVRLREVRRDDLLVRSNVVTLVRDGRSWRPP